MKRLVFTICSIVAVVGAAAPMAKATEFWDHTIVVSDNWCASLDNKDCNQCDAYHVVTRARCTGSYCDNMIFTCGDPPQDAGPGSEWTQMGSLQLTGWTSDEQGMASTRAVCPFGYAMVGMNSTGNYSDNVQAICIYVQHVLGWSAGPWRTLRQSTISISEENGGIGPTNGWFSGASCTGSYCDNMYYWFTELGP